MSRARPPRNLHSVFERSMREVRRSLIGWFCGIVGFSLIMLSIYPTVHGNAGFSQLLNAYPEALRKLFDISDYTTGPGYLRTEVFSFMAPLLLAIFAILWGADLTAGEEERHTIDTLLATPISRQRVVVEKWLALALAIVTLALALEVLLGVVGPLFKLHVGWAPLSAAVIGSALFALAFGTLAMAIGAGTGSRGFARGVSAAIAVAMYLVSTLSQLVEWLKPWRWTSLWYHALGIDPLSNGFEAGHLIVMAVCVAILVLAAVVLFTQRDFSN
ncbi:MAG: ABC transporter permease subunit [Acidimicrobiales bacterium]